MCWQFAVAIAVIVPIVLMPVALVWYLNIGGLVAALKARREKEALKAGLKEVA